MVTIAFLAFLALAITIALVDWRRGWYLVFLCSVLQDPARKLTAGTPVMMSFSAVAVYAVILLAASVTLQRSARDLTRRFSGVFQFWAVLALFLALAAVNGVMTYGLPYWKVPAISLLIYLMPFTALVLGYAWSDSEAAIDNFLKVYAGVTAVLLAGTFLEYSGYTWRSLGMVGMPEGFIRHLPGIQIKTLSGFYRAPDIMGWHAAMLTSVAIAFAVRRRSLVRAWPWMLLVGWGFLNCIISGRRKAVYMAVVFAIAFIVTYVRRMRLVEVGGLVTTLLVALLVMRNIASDEKTSVYARGAATTQQEVLQRFEGGFFGTIEQFGIFGAGLGSATQGVYHLLEGREQVGWQEGGIGKLTVELGLPGLLAVLLFGIALFYLLWKIATYPDDPASAQATRATLFAIVVANVANFIASAQAYSDPGLTLTTAFLVGALLATARMEAPSLQVRTPAAGPAPTPLHA